MKTLTFIGVMIIAVLMSIGMMIKMKGTGMQYQDMDPTRSHVEWVMPEELDQETNAEELAEFPGIFFLPEDEN